MVRLSPFPACLLSHGQLEKLSVLGSHPVISEDRGLPARSLLFSPVTSNQRLGTEGKKDVSERPEACGPGPERYFLWDRRGEIAWLTAVFQGG